MTVLAYWLTPIGLGFVCQGIARLSPFRQMAAKAEHGWDVGGYLGTTFFAFLIATLVRQPAYGCLEGMAWIAIVRNVTARFPWWVLALLTIVLTDLLNYWSHRALHSRWLWDQHAWHHAPQRLNWVSGNRASLVHMLVATVPTIVIPVSLLFPIEQFVGTSLFITMLSVFIQHYIHSNIKLPYQRQLEVVLVTPRYHFVHHSTTRAYSDSNYAFILAWDRLFGTFTDPEIVPKNDPLGLNYDTTNWRLILGLPAPKTMHHTDYTGATILNVPN